MRDEDLENRPPKQELLDLLPHIVLEINLKGIITHSNPHGLSSTGYTQTDLKKGIRFTQLFVPEDRKRVMENHVKTLAGKIFMGHDYTLLRKDGSTFSVTIYSHPIIKSGKPVGIKGIVVDVTDRKQTEAALQKSEAKYRKMFELSPEAIVLMDKEGKLLDVNQRLIDLLDCKPEELIGKDFLKLPFLTKESKILAREIFLKRMKGIETPPYEIEFITKRGERRTGLAIASLVRDAEGRIVQNLALISDITEKKQFTDAILTAKQEWERTFDTVPELIFILDEKFTIRRLNKATANRLGATPAQLVGKTCYEVVHGTDKPPAYCPHAKMLADGKAQFIEVYEERLGGDFYVTVTPFLNSQGEIIGAVHTAVDISERKWIEDLLRNQRDLAQSLSVTMNLKRALTLCLQTAIRVSGMDSGCVYLIDRSTNDLNLIHSEGLSSKFVRAVSCFAADSQMARLVLAGKPVYQKSPKHISNSKDPFLQEEGLRTLAIVPVICEGDVFACLDIASHTLEEISMSARNALETVAAQIGDVIMRINTEEKLQATMNQLQALTSHLQDVREQERIQIARELHDELSSMLTVLKMGIVKISDKLTANEKSCQFKEIIEKTESMEELINKSVVLVRKMISRLRPAILDDLGLIAAIEWLLEEFEADTGIKCKLRSNLEELDFDTDESTSVFRILQEILTNTARHAGASTIDVKLKKTEEVFKMEVKDNGCGIDQSDMEKNESFGIIGMRERANLFGWDFNISGIKGKGTTVILTVKLREKRYD